MWLEQLDAPVPEDRESLGDRWWRWVLARCGVACALAWTVWVERADRWLLLMPLARRTRSKSAQRTAANFPVELNALLPLTEAAELLGFATIAQGDITLTSLGKTFAEASIQARKEIFATRIRRLPLFQWLLSMLQAADTHQLEKDIVTAALELDFTPEEAARQVEVAINWGRYAEFLAYNDHTASIDLENHTAAEPPQS